MIGIGIGIGIGRDEETEAVIAKEVEIGIVIAIARGSEVAAVAVEGNLGDNDHGSVYLYDSGWDVWILMGRSNLRGSSQEGLWTT